MGRHCAPLVISKKGGKPMLELRPWQKEAVSRALAWLVVERSDRHFLINAAPGAGKTIASCVIAKELIDRNEVDRVIVIAPRREVVRQWADDFRNITGRHMMKVTGSDSDVAGELDVCATWAAIESLKDIFQATCHVRRTLVVCDEHHHAAVKAAWGSSADSAFKDAAFVLVLTGTPIRSDNEQSVWLAYDDAGHIDHPQAGTYTLSYGDAVNLGYCRPVTFHRHEGRFTVDLQDGTSVHVSGQGAIDAEQLRIPSLKRALNFYRLACTPQYEADDRTPKRDGYQATMVEWAAEKLTDLRDRLPNAGGLVIAPSIEIADYFQDLIEMMEGERPICVHSHTPNVESKIEAFRNTDKRWLVSVNMISEGVDIKRLRVLVYLPSALTELAFRQAIGRVVRSAGRDDDSRAYVVMPSFQVLEEFARRVEGEMPAWAKRAVDGPKKKRCPACESECDLGVTICPACGHEFPARKPKFKTCHACQAPNPIGASSCQECGASFTVQFNLTLDEALRVGVIVRGMDIDEAETQESEAIGPALRERIIRSGDVSLINLINSVPIEAMARLKKLVQDE